MIRHISLFTLDPQPANGRTMEENRAALIKALETIAARLPTAVGGQVGVAPVTPRLPEGEGPLFAQVAQVIDFACPEDAAAYPTSDLHLALVREFHSVLRNVTAIDYPV